jgi:hypothetical protein
MLCSTELNKHISALKHYLKFQLSLSIVCVSRFITYILSEPDAYSGQRTLVCLQRACHMLDIPQVSLVYGFSRVLTLCVLNGAQSCNLQHAKGYTLVSKLISLHTCSAISKFPCENDIVV